MLPFRTTLPVCQPNRVVPMRLLAKLHYAWVVAGVTFLTLLAAAGVRATPGVLIVPLEAEFGWSRATISFAVGRAWE